MTPERPLSEYLNALELRTVTKAAHARAQAKVFDAEGVPYKMVNGAVVVSRLHVRAWLEGRAVIASNGPNWNHTARA